ncbi:MAG: hypothetical protein Q4A83_08355 [Bacillota bacterium]|nr:hypothetical protein [Bacillota bacterium]
MKRKTQARAVTTLLITGLLLYGAVFLATAASELRDALELTRAMTEEMARAEGENITLKERATDIGSEESIKAEAEEFFDFIDPHEIIFADLD